jgi:hypothetical protein
VTDRLPLDSDHSAADLRLIGIEYVYRRAWHCFDNVTCSTLTLGS